MRTALTSFEEEIAKLDMFLCACDAEVRLMTAIGQLPDCERAALEASAQVIRRHHGISRRQVYFSSIIVMYGALERFVEDAVAEYAETLVDICQGVDRLPEKLREQHTRLTIDYLFLLKEGKIRETDGITTIVETLYHCLSGKGPARLNARAFSLRASNMKMTRIREIMRSLEVQIPPRRVLSMPSYTAHLKRDGGRAVADMRETEVESALEHIDYLVGLRNDIAHGVGNVGDIENNGIVRSRCAGLRAFAGSLNEILFCELLRARIARGQMVRVEGGVQVFRDRIACFSFPTGRLMVGDRLVMQPGGDGADLRHGRILSIEIDRVRQTEVEGRVGLMVGVCVEFKVKANGIFYVWHTMSARRGQ